MRFEAPVRTRFRDLDVYACGPWCQGPVLLEALNILRGYDLVSMSHNSADYLHLVVSALDAAFSAGPGGTWGATSCPAVGATGSTRARPSAWPTGSTRCSCGGANCSIVCSVPSAGAAIPTASRHASRME